MLIQAACIARLANTVNKSATPFVVMAIYFNKKSFDRYLVYQPDNSSTTVWKTFFSLPQYLPPTVQTYYTVEKFEILDAYRSFLFLFELYNYSSVASRLQENLEDPASRIEALNIDFRKRQMPTFYTNTGSKKRGRESGDSGDARPPPGPSQLGSSRVQGSVFDDPIVRSELSSAGYDVAEPWVDLEMEPFDRVSQAFAQRHILMVSR